VLDIDLSALLAGKQAEEASQGYFPVTRIAAGGNWAG